MCQYLFSIGRPHDHFHCLSFPYLHHSCKHPWVIITGSQRSYSHGLEIIKRVVVGYQIDLCVIISQS